MKRILRLVAMAAAPALTIGCTSIPVTIDPPSIPLGTNSIKYENPVYIPLAPTEYGTVFQAILQTLGDFGFEVPGGDSNRYDGRIEAAPATAPGLALLLKAGTPDLYERLLFTLQSYRYRTTVLIQPATQGGFFIQFIVRKELEDVPRPVRSTVGGSVFRTENTAERQKEVIDPTFFESTWIYKGRDAALEQELIQSFLTCKLLTQPPK